MEHVTHIDRQVVGFFNPRNSCFLNSSMQLLLSITPLSQLCETATTPFLSALREAKRATQSTDLLRPNSHMWHCVELFVGYSPRALMQHDAFEFLMFFCANLDEELPKRPRKEAEPDDWSEVSDGRHRAQATQSSHYGVSLLYNLMGLTIRHEYHVIGSQKTIRVIQEDLMTCVDAGESLERGFEELLSDSAVEDYKDEGVAVRCKRSGKIDGFSPYLLIALKRFQASGPQSAKIDTFVAFPQRLNIPNRLLTPTLSLSVTSGQHPAANYTLVGFLMHHGKSLSQGHYTSVIHTQGRWLSVDDQRIQPVESTWVRRQKAYVLLYVHSD